MESSLNEKQRAVWEIVRQLTPLVEEQVRQLTEDELDSIALAKTPARIRAVLAEAYVRMANSARANARKRVLEEHDKPG